MNSLTNKYFSNLNKTDEIVWEHCNIRNIEIGSPDFRISFLNLDSSHKVKEITHTLTSEIVIVFEGSLQAQVGEQSKTINKNDIIYIPKNTIHSFKTITQNASLLVIHAPFVPSEFDHKAS